MIRNASEHVLLEIIGVNEKHEGGYFLHQAQLLMLNHRLLPECNFLVIFQVNKLLEGTQILVKLALDGRLSSGEAQLVGII